ncbi:hypothetical protein AMK31_10920 [Streptomyces sp. TSRI0107]|nr:hypothetical protein AMK31_10920 [Streptomyces sp. TSRI0107]
MDRSWTASFAVSNTLDSQDVPVEPVDALVLVEPPLSLGSTGASPFPVPVPASGSGETVLTYSSDRL